jgi:hypothetical protein
MGWLEPRLVESSTGVTARKSPIVGSVHLSWMWPAAGRVNSMASPPFCPASGPTQKGLSREVKNAARRASTVSFASSPRKRRP